MTLLIRLFILVLIFGATVLSLIVSNKIEKALPGYRPLYAAILGVLFGVALFAFISRIIRIKKDSITTEILSSQSSLIGVGLAVIAFNFSLAAFSFTHEISFIGFNFSNLPAQVFSQIRPALIEEIGFRFGLALFTSLYYGRSAGVLAGTIPFGVLHLLNFTSGQPIIWAYIVGTSVAGAFFTLVFFRHGLFAAIFCHYTWNVLASLSARSFTFTQTALEAAPTTLLILISFTVWLWLDLEKISQELKNPSTRLRF